MNAAAASNRSGLRGANTSRALRYSPCATPNAISASGSSVATTLPATISGRRPFLASSASSHSASGVLFGSSKSYFRFPAILTFSGEAPNALTRSASFSLCIQKPAARPSASFKNGRR